MKIDSLKNTLPKVNDCPFFIFLLILSSNVFAQTAIWSKGFETYSKVTRCCSGTIASTAIWSTNDNNVNKATLSPNNGIRRKDTDHFETVLITTTIHVF